MEKITNPYGNLLYVIGNDDDFVCFDYHVFGDGKIALHSVINSETGGFIETGEYMEVEITEAPNQALSMVDHGIEWCVENGIELETSKKHYDFYLNVCEECEIIPDKLILDYIKKISE